MMAATFDINLDRETQDRLKTLAALRGYSLDRVMRAAILEYLDRKEAYEREKKEDQERWERYELNGEVAPHEPVATWLEEIAAGRPTSWRL